MTDETRRKIDKAIKIGLIVAGLLLIANDVYWRWYSRSSSTADNNVNRTVESIQAANESARSELESSSRETERAEEHVERAADAVARSTEAATRNSGGVDQLEKIISDSQKIVENQRGLISEDLYKKLTEQMELERKKAKRVKHQRNLYAGCVIFILAYAATK